MKIHIVALLICALVLSSEARKGKPGKGKLFKFLMMLKMKIENSVCSESGNALDGFTCAEGDMAMAFPGMKCADLTAGEKPPKPDMASKPNKDYPCKDAAIGDDWTSESLAWVCITGERRDKTVADPLSCRDIIISGTCVANTRPRGPDVVPQIDACTTA